MHAVEILKKAKALISDPSRWTQEAFAKNAQGQWTFFSGEDAVCWCSLGALAKIVQDVCRTPHRSVSVGRAHAHLSAAMLADVVYFNDSHTHAEVMEARDRAIAAASDAAPSGR